jgi:hypothetical protein
MQLSRGWGALIIFWVWVVSFCGFGAVTLQFLGPPFPSASSVQARSSDVAPERLETLATVASSSAVPASTPMFEAPREPVASAPQSDDVATADTREAQSQPVLPVPVSVTVPSYHVSITPEIQIPLTEPAPEQSPHAASSASDARERQPPPGKKVQLRVGRDSKSCPNATCLRWHLVQQRSKPPRGASLDLARLRLAPDLREAAEAGKVELIVDAVEQHKSIRGRDSVTFVATDLAGVTSHEKEP